MIRLVRGTPLALDDLRERDGAGVMERGRRRKNRQTGREKDTVMVQRHAGRD